MQSLYRFEFHEDVSKGTLEFLITHAVLASESVFGKSVVRSCFGYYLSESGTKMVIRALDAAGAHIVLILVGFLKVHIGKEAFVFEKIPD